MVKFGDKDRRWGSSFDWRKSCAIEDGEENGKQTEVDVQGVFLDVER